MVKFDRLPPEKYREGFYPLSLLIEEPLHPMRTQCPACATGPSRNNVFSADHGEFVSYEGVVPPRPCSWFKRLFGGCREKRAHLHRKCTWCKHRWIDGFVK